MNANSAVKIRVAAARGCYFRISWVYKKPHHPTQHPANRVRGSADAPPPPSEATLDRNTRLDLAIRLHNATTDARDLCANAELSLADARTVRGLLKQAEKSLVEGKAGATRMLLKTAERVMGRG